MNDRGQLHRLVDALPNGAMSAVARYLESVCAGAQPDAPDDEPLAAETEAMIAASRAALTRGATLTHEELLARRAAHRKAV
jgi:hypothetical protein